MYREGITWGFGRNAGRVFKGVAAGWAKDLRDFRHDNG